MTRWLDQRWRGAVWGARRLAPGMLGVLVWFGLAGEAAAQKTNRVAITKPPPQYTEDIDTYRARYRYESDRLAAEYDTKASKYRRADGTVDTSDPGWQKLNNKYKQEAAKLRNEYNSQHPSQTSINEVRKTPAGQSLEKTGSDVSSPFSDGDWTAGSDADAAGVVEQLRQKGHRITYDEKLGMYHDETADTKIWEPENPSRSKARASNPEGYTRAGSLEHEGIKSENAQYDPRGYVEDLYKKYEAAKAKGDTRTMNKVAAKMQEATGQRFDPRTQTMRVDGNPLEAGEATLGESPEIRGRKAQAAQQRLDQVVENARTRAEIQSESLTHQRTDLAKQEQGHGKLKSAEEYLEANRKIQRTEPKAGEPAKADAKAPKTEPKPGTKPDGKVPKTMAESAPKGETWRNVLTGKELPVGTSGNQYVDKTAKALSNSKVQAGLQAVGAVMVAKDGYDTVNAVNEAAERGDLDEANKIGSKGVGRLTGAWIGAEAGGKLGAAVGAGLGDGPGGIVGGFLGALGGGILGGMVGDAVGEEVGPGAINKVRDAAVDMATRDVEGAPPGSAEWMRSKGIAPEKVEEFSRRLAAVATSDTAEDNAKKIWQEIKDEVKQARATAVASDGTADGGAGASAGGDVDGGGGSGGAVDAGVGAGGVIAGAGGSGASVGRVGGCRAAWRSVVVYPAAAEVLLGLAWAAHEGGRTVPREAMNTRRLRLLPAARTKARPEWTAKMAAENLRPTRPRTKNTRGIRMASARRRVMGATPIRARQERQARHREPPRVAMRGLTPVKLRQAKNRPRRIRRRNCRWRRPAEKSLIKDGSRAATAPRPTWSKPWMPMAT